MPRYGVYKRYMWSNWVEWHRINAHLKHTYECVHLLVHDDICTFPICSKGCLNSTFEMNTNEHRRSHAHYTCSQCKYAHISTSLKYGQAFGVDNLIHCHWNNSKHISGFPRKGLLLLLLFSHCCSIRRQPSSHYRYWYWYKIHHRICQNGILDGVSHSCRFLSCSLHSVAPFDLWMGNFIHYLCKIYLIACKFV